jgi:hypothetical protein
LRKRFKIPLITVAVLVFVIVIGAVWAVKSGWLTQRAVALVNERALAETNLSVDVGRLSGNVFHRFGLELVTVTTRDGRDTVATIDRIFAEYDWRQLWRGDWNFSLIAIDSLRIHLPRDSILPFVTALMPQRESDAPRSAPLLSVTVDTLRIDNARVLQLGDGTAIADSIEVVASVSYSGGEVDGRLRRGVFHEPHWGRTELSGVVSVRPDGWSVDSLRLVTARSHVSGRGNAEKWIVTAHPVDFHDLALVVEGLPDAQFNFDGEIVPPRQDVWHIAGTATGTIEEFELESVSLGFAVEGSHLAFDSLRGFIQGSYWDGTADLNVSRLPVEYRYTGTVRGFDLARWVDDGIPSNLSGHVSGTGFGFADPELVLDLTVNLGQGSFNDIDFDHASGRMSISLDDVVIDDDFVVRWGHNQFEGGGRIQYDDSLDVFGNIYSDDLRSWRRLVGVDSLGGRSSGYVYIFGETASPDLAGRIISDSLVLAGITTRDLAASIHVPDFLTPTEGTITAQLGQSAVGAIDVDSAYIRASLVGPSLRFDSIIASSASLTIRGRGRLDWSDPRVQLQFFPLDLTWEADQFSAGDTIGLYIDSSGIDLDLLSVESTFGYFETLGRYWFNDSIDFILGVEGFPVAPVWRRFFPTTDVSGEFDCTGLLYGTLSDPIVELDVVFSSLTYGDFRPGRLAGEVYFSDGHLRTEGLTLERRRMEAIFSGVLPMNFSIDPPIFELPDKPIEGYLTATGDALPVAYFLPETVEYLRGPFSVSAAVSGTINSPLFHGNMFIRSGELKAVEIANPVEDLSADIRLVQDTILIERAEGIIRDKRKRGRVNATGNVRILTYTTFDYNLHVTGRTVPARFEFEDYYVESDFDLDVIGVTPPLVRGTISPVRIEDRMPFDDEIGPGTIDTTTWDWDLEIVMPGNYWIQNDQINAELTVDIRLLRQRGEITYLGTAEVIRGQVYLFDKTGRIRRGVLSFNNVGEPNPELDIEVSFRIRRPRIEGTFATENSQVDDLNLHVGGTAAEPIIGLLDPETGYTEQDVLLLLTTNTLIGATGDDLARDPWAERLRFAATGLLLSEVQRVAARKLGIETLEITSGGAAENTEVTVGRYFTSSLYLYGTSPIDVGGGQEVGFEYRFNRNMFLEGRRDRENLYRLSVHFSWDY